MLLLYWTPLYIKDARISADSATQMPSSAPLMLMPGAPPRGPSMADDGAHPTFLGLIEESDGERRESDGETISTADDRWPQPDVMILSVPYELTTSYGQGTAEGPAACIAASAQVELHDPLLPEELPCGFRIRTAESWDGEGDSLATQQNGIVSYLTEELSPAWLTEEAVNPFPLVLGGEHGLLPAILRTLREHPALARDGGEPLAALTLVQVDAHADLRNELDGDSMSHACTARRALDLGVGDLIQVGVRAWSRDEEAFAAAEPRVRTHLASNLLSPCSGEGAWRALIADIQALSGPIWLTFDIDGLDGSLVPTTGTPVPGGLSWWHAVELIEALFEAEDADVLGADIVEIVPSAEGNLTEFTAAMVSTKIVAAHLARRLRRPQSDRCDQESSDRVPDRITHTRGDHVMIDYIGWIDPDRDAAAWILDRMVEAAKAEGCRVVHAHGESFDGSISPPGFAAVVLIDESHLSAHCYSNLGLLAIDCFTCGDSDAQAVADRLDASLVDAIPTLERVEGHRVERFVQGSSRSNLEATGGSG